MLTCTWCGFTTPFGVCDNNSCLENGQEPITGGVTGLSRYVEEAKPAPEESPRSPDCYSSMAHFVLASKACIDLYLSLHVSQMDSQNEQIKRVWSVGQELYFASQKDE